MGRFAADPRLSIVDSFEVLLEGLSAINPSEPCVRLSGDLVLSTPQLNRILIGDGERCTPRSRTLSSDRARGGSISTGPLADLIRATHTLPTVVTAAGDLPFALNGHVEDRDEAELRLARALKNETAFKDAPLARCIDRNLSWRISKRLAKTSVTPNQVTVANTMVGLLSGWLFAFPGSGSGSWIARFSLLDHHRWCRRRIGATHADRDQFRWNARRGHRQYRSRRGIYRNISGMYRASGSQFYIYLTPLALGGFATCLIAIYVAMQVGGRRLRNRGKSRPRDRP